MNIELWRYIFELLAADPATLTESQRKHAAFWRQEMEATCIQ